MEHKALVRTQGGACSYQIAAAQVKNSMSLLIPYNPVTHCGINFLAAAFSHPAAAASAGSRGLSDSCSAPKKFIFGLIFCSLLD